MLEIIQDAVFDVAKLLPFLFITYIIMEYIEHKMTEKSKKAIQKSGKLGPLFGGIVGIVPQCGFSASATNLYAARVISLGTLISVYLSTSDEMLPILISESVSLEKIIKILAIKVIIGIISGFIIDFILKIFKKEKLNDTKIEDLCEHENCDCQHGGIFKSAIKHTVNILIYIFIITLIINFAVEFIGEDNISNFVGRHAIIGPMIASLLGLVPNCASSVIITNLYLENIINGASMIGGLLTGAGVGLIVLFKMNKNLKENIKIVAIVYGIGAISGIVLQAIGFVI